MQPTEAAPAAFDPGGYPVQGDVVTPGQIDRWRVFQVIAAIPHLVILYALRVAAEVAVIIAWFAILFTGSFPEGLWNFVVGVERWQWRVTTYSLFLHTKYPPFQLDSGENDPATEPAVYAVRRPVERNRLTCGLRFIWVIPAAIVYLFVAFAAFVCMVVGWFAVLFGGRWPEGLRNFVVGALRWGLRVEAYAFLLIDEYPPFAMES